MNKSSKRTLCRLCESDQIIKVIELPETTIGDYFSKTKDEIVVKYPIDLYYCNKCSHVQVIDVINPEILFHNEFTYMPSNNPSLETHFENYIDFVLKEIPNPKICVDIGSNDGLFLSIINKKTNAQVLGIDPAEGPAQFAISRGVDTVIDFFNNKSFNIVKDKFGSVNWISANNVFAHNDKLIDMLKQIYGLLDDDGIFTFEISYLLDIVEKGLIGTIFHEHLSYHSIYSLSSFFKKYNMSLIDVKRVDTQGGALIGIVRKGIHYSAENVVSLLSKEKEFGLNKIDGIKKLKIRIESDKKKLNDIFKIEGINGNIVAFGAARSSNLLVEYFDIGRHIKYIVDDNPTKKDKYFPNYKIPIVPKTVLEKDKPEYIIILAWIHTKKLTDIIKQISPKSKIITLYPKIDFI